MIWIAITCGLISLGLVVAFCWWLAPKLDPELYGGRPSETDDGVNRPFEGQEDSALVIDEATRFTREDYDRAQKAFIKHWEGKLAERDERIQEQASDLREKWNDPPEADDG